MGNYTSTLYFRNPSNIRTLMLPAAGYRYLTVTERYAHGRGNLQRLLEFPSGATSKSVQPVL